MPTDELTEGAVTRVLALACHPDDIEFMMAGTFLLLGEAGCELHYMNLANGSCGTTQFAPREIIAIRREEGRRAAALAKACFHPSLVNDLEVFYTPELIRRVAAVIRRVRPALLLVPSPEDYMEDHMNTARVAVTAAFTRGMPNYITDPFEEPYDGDVVIYHALPYGLTDGLRRPVMPDCYIDVTAVMDRKVAMLACHASQKRWLDESQGLDSYLETARDLSRSVGTMSGRFQYAEGWRRHSHLGYASREVNPLAVLLQPYYSEAP